MRLKLVLSVGVSETRCKAEYQYIERRLLGGEIFYEDNEGAVII